MLSVFVLIEHILKYEYQHFSYLRPVFLFSKQRRMCYDLDVIPRIRHDDYVNLVNSDLLASKCIPPGALPEGILVRLLPVLLINNIISEMGICTTKSCFCSNNSTYHKAPTSKSG